MSRTVATATRPQLALQSYLDSLLQEAAVEFADSISLDEFEAPCWRNRFVMPG